MELVTLQSEVYIDLVKRLDEIVSRLPSEEKKPKEQWVDNEEFMKQRKISRRTAQNYRDTGMISFAQIGHKIYYRQADIDEFLKKHYNKAFK